MQLAWSGYFKNWELGWFLSKDDKHVDGWDEVNIVAA